MDRALNAQDVADALGQHAPGVLPTVAELTELIAAVEIRAFQRNFVIDTVLLRTAWYLHGVASASEATDLYTPARQRRAFGVSAHIFDLALGDTERRAHDRLTLAFGAQVGYRRADLAPNATAIYRRVIELLSADGDAAGHVQTFALEAGVAFLGLDVRQLNRLLSTWRRQLNTLAGLLDLDDLRTTMFGPAEQIVLAVSALLVYLRRGDGTQLDVARAALVSVVDQSAGVGDHDARWVAAHLLAVADGMETSSVWAVLPPDTPAAVAQAFTVGTPPVLTLWPPQRELLERSSCNPLAPDTKRLLLSVPTSAGKTLMAQLIICRHLATQPRDVCYITPLRSLGREMRQALSSRLRVLNRELGPDLPDYVGGDLDALFAMLAEAPRGEVEVMTPERLMQLLRRDPEAVLERFSLFVVDEAHLLAQPGRGFLLEALLSFLAVSDARLVLLSGVLGNAASIANWLAPDQAEVLFTSAWRGPRRMHALLYADPLWDHRVETPRKSKEYPTTVRVPLRAKLRVKPAEAKIVSLVSDESQPLGELVLRKSIAGKMEKADGATPAYKIAATAATALLHAGSLLMVVSQRDLTRSAAEVIASELEPLAASRDLTAFLEQRLGAAHPLVGCVRNGVAFHHAGLPVDVLDAVEEALRNEQLRAVVATSTLTDGVNLPVRTVLVAETTYEGQQPGVRLDAPRLLNAVGRAGRAGKETEGWIVLALQQREADADFKQLQPDDADLEVHSTLVGDAAIAALAEAEALIATTADALFRLPPGPATDFASHVWFILSALEQLEQLRREQNLATVLDRFLGFQEMDAELRDRWYAFAEVVERTYAATDPGQRRRWVSAGTSLGTAALLDAAVDGVVDAAAARAPQDLTDVVEMTLQSTLTLLADLDVLGSLLTYPEADGAWTFRSRRRGPVLQGVPLVDALDAWIAGAEMTDLADRLLSDVSDEAFRIEQMVDGVSRTFEHYLAWTVGVIVEQANARLEGATSFIRLRSDAAWCIRFGVDTPEALTLLTRGMRSRRLAHQLGRVAAERGLTMEQLSEWLAELHITGWREQFDVTPREVLDLLELTRSRRQSLLRDLLEVGNATAAVRRRDEGPPGSVTVVIESDAPGAELRLIAADRDVLGVVAAASHADVEAVLASGLDVGLEVDGESLLLTAQDAAPLEAPTDEAAE